MVIVEMAEYDMYKPVNTVEPKVDQVCMHSHRKTANLTECPSMYFKRHRDDERLKRLTSTVIW